MTISLKHKFSSAKADTADASLVRPSNWNDEHNITMATARLLGRTTGGVGAVEEITVGTALTLSATNLAVDKTVVDNWGATTDGYGYTTVMKFLNDFVQGLICTKTGATTVSISAGAAKGNLLYAAMTSAMSKDLGSVFAVGTGAGGRDTAAALVANTTYHIHAIRNNTTGAIDFLFSTSATAPTVPSGFSLLIRIWAVYYGTSAIFDFQQSGNQCTIAQGLYVSTSAPIADAAYVIPVGIPVPGGVPVEVLLNGGVSITAAGGGGVGNFGAPGSLSFSAIVSIGLSGTGFMGNFGWAKTDTSRFLRMSTSNTNAIVSAYINAYFDFTIPRLGAR